MENFRQLTSTQRTPSNLLRLLNTKHVILLLFYDEDEKNCEVVSYALTQNGIAEYKPVHYLEKKSSLSDTSHTVNSAEEWKRCFNDENYYINIYNEYYDYTDLSPLELAKYILSCSKKGNDCELYISSDIGNFYGPLEINLIERWLRMHPDYHLDTFTRDIGIFTVSYGGCLISINDKTAETIEIPEDVKSLNSHLLKNSKAKKLILPESLSHISPVAFCESPALEEVVFPESLLNIGGFAFAHCPVLKTVDLPKKLKSIDDYAFSDCSSLESIIIPENVTEISKGCFSGCTALKSVSIPVTLKTIKAKAFYECTALKDINLSAEIALSSDSFYRCSKEVSEKAERCFFLHKLSEQSRNRSKETKNFVSSSVIVLPEDMSILQKGTITFDKKSKANLPKTLIIPENVSRAEENSIPSSISCIYLLPSSDSFRFEQSVLYTNLPLEFIFHFGRDIELKNTYRLFDKKTFFVSFADDSVYANGEQITNEEHYSVIHIKTKDDMRDFILKYGDKLPMAVKEKLFDILKNI